MKATGRTFGALLLIWGPTALILWLCLADATQVRLVVVALLQLLGG